jgi:hypothetical protein
VSNFDWIDVRGNKVGIPYNDKTSFYQTKEMSCDLYIYKFTDDNRLVHKLESDRYTYYNKRNIQIPTSQIIQNGEMEITGDYKEPGCKNKEVMYFLEFVNGVVVKVVRHTSASIHEDEGVLLFSNASVHQNG